MRMMRLRNKKGFTLIEVVVILAVIGILAAVLTPMLTSYIDDARQRRAESDVKAIGAAICAFNKDLRKWPIYQTKDAATPVDVLYSDAGDGAAGAAAKGFDTSSNADTLENQLITNAPNYSTNGKRKWRGPYLESINSDPWGHRYYVSVIGLQPGKSNYAAFVLSAGPNGTIDINASQTISAFSTKDQSGEETDDIVYRIK